MNLSMAFSMLYNGISKIQPGWQQLILSIQLATLKTKENIAVELRNMAVQKLGAAATEEEIAAEVEKIAIEQAHKISIN